MTAPRSNWRDLSQQRDPEGHERLVTYIGSIATKDEIDAKHRELILLATSSVIRYRSSMRTHALRAREQGATDEELLHAIQLAGLTGGVTCVIEGLELLEELDVVPPGP